MRRNFKAYFKFMIYELEGGDKVHTVKGDPGGTTKYGFAKKFHPDLDIPSLTYEKAEDLALKEYWIPNGCDRLPWPADVIVFDTAYNQSAAFARTIAIEAENWQDLILLRMLRYSDKSNPSFLLGLYNRVEKIYAFLKLGGLEGG